MKTKTLLTLVFVLLALPAFGAVQYDFFQKSTFEGGLTPTSEFTARATVDGLRSRIEFLSGDAYPAGTYAVSTDGARHLFFVDPQKQWFTEFNIASAVTAVAATGLKITNLKADAVKLDDVELVAGVPTEHYQLRISYDISLNYRQIPMTQNVITVIDTRTTTQFGDLGAAFGSEFATGNAEVDKLIAAETTKIAGFPLRQNVTITLRFTSGRPAKSNLQVAPTRVITREMRVTSIRETATTPMAFTIPATYRKAEPGDLPKAPPVQVLQMEPVTK
jgi:hypothetical protein